MIDSQKEQRLWVALREFAYGGTRKEFLQQLAEIQADAETFAAALLHAGEALDGARWANVRSGVNAHLQLLLTQEHIAAQRRMSEAADQLAAASLDVAHEAHKTARLSFWLTLASVIVAIGSLISAVLIATA